MRRGSRISLISAASTTKENDLQPYLGVVRWAWPIVPVLQEVRDVLAAPEAEARCKIILFVGPVGLVVEEGQVAVEVGLGVSTRLDCWVGSAGHLTSGF